MPLMTLLHLHYWYCSFSFVFISWRSMHSFPTNE